MTMAKSWASIGRELQRRPPGAKVKRACNSMPHPADEGAELGTGLPAGQIRDWRFPPEPDCTGLHVHEMNGRWEAHLDRVHPSCSPIEHARIDAPPLFIGGGVLLGALAGGLAGWKGVAIGAVAGGVLGAVLLAVPKFNWEKR